VILEFIPPLTKGRCDVESTLLFFRENHHGLVEYIDHLIEDLSKKNSMNEENTHPQHATLEEIDVVPRKQHSHVPCINI